MKGSRKRINNTFIMRLIGTLFLGSSMASRGGSKEADSV